jgi:hypothetical protein
MADQELVILNQTTVATSNESKIFLFKFQKIGENPKISYEFEIGLL